MVRNVIRAWRDQLLARIDHDVPCPLGWIPSVFTPVFYGYRDHELSLAPPPVVATAAAGPFVKSLPGSIDVKCRVFYPSLDGSPHNAPPLTGCATTPLLVFSHGQCEPGSVPSDFYQAWYELPATLARAGYVVIVPQYLSPGSDEDIERLVRVTRWARSEASPYAEMLRPSPDTGLVGHSYGGAMTAKVITENRMSVSAVALLSPEEAALRDSSTPLLWMWGEEGSEATSDPRIDFWTPSGPTHAVQFLGADHHDYLPSGRAPCAVGQQSGMPLMPFLAADIVALFFGRYLPQDRPRRTGWPWFIPRPHIRISLQPGNWFRTTEQKFFAGGWFSAWPLLDTGNYDPVELHYRSGGEWHRVVRGD